MSEEREASQSSRGIGTFARRLGRWVADVSEAVSFPESLRSAIAQAFGEQARGEQGQAARTLLNLSVQRNVAALATAAEVLLSLGELDRMPPKSDASPKEARALLKLIEKGKAGALLEVSKHLEARNLDEALDILRRERARDLSLPPELAPVRLFALSLWSAQGDFAYGRFSRTLLELNRINAHLLAIVSNYRAALCVDAAEMAIAAAMFKGDVASLDEWSELVERIIDTQPGDLADERDRIWQQAKERAVQLAVRLQIHRRDSKLQQSLPALPLGEMHLRAEIAGLIPTPHDKLPASAIDFPDSWRLSLSRRLRRWVQDPNTAAFEELREEFLTRKAQIEESLTRAAPGALGALLAEYAFFAIAVEDSAIDWSIWTRQLDRQQHSHPATLQMAQALALLQDPDCELAKLRSSITGASSDLALGSHLGYDESSPLRWPSLRDPVFFGVLSLLRGQCELREGKRAPAEQHLAQALSCWPYLRRAQAALDEMQPTSAAPTLQAQLALLAEQFAPQSSDPLELQTLLRRCHHALVSERERLSRPFTLAVMGEFSAGKSTFVNALIGREVAPMGVLPTTNTVNRFRHGKGTIRVHYENGKIEYIDASDGHELLSDINEEKAKTIQYLDIEGDFEQLADLVIVDTPGLNATQAHHERITRSFVDQADAVLWIFSATRAGASTESEIIASLEAESRPILGLLNKTDTISQEEQEELLDYLRQQFGAQLLDIVPICASQALASRQGPQQQEQDRSSLRVIQSSLREHLLDKSPEHKREVARSQSIRALDYAAQELRKLLVRNEGEQSPMDPKALQQALARDLLAVQDAWLQLDSFLLRVALDLGVAASGRGRLIESLPEQDRRYLHQRAQQHFFARLDRLLRPRDEEQRASDHQSWQKWARSLSDWLDGYWAALASQESLSELVLSQAPQAKQSERAYREALRAGLLRCSGSFADSQHPLAQRMQSWLRAGLSAHADQQADPDAYLQRVLLPKLLSAQKSLQTREPEPNRADETKLV